MFYSLSIGYRVCEATYTPPFTYKTGLLFVSSYSYHTMVDTKGNLYGARISEVSTGDIAMIPTSREIIFFGSIGNSSSSKYHYKETIECVSLDSTGNKKSSSYKTIVNTSYKFLELEDGIKGKALYPSVRLALETSSSEFLYLISAPSFFVKNPLINLSQRCDCYGYLVIKKSDFSTHNTTMVGTVGTSTLRSMFSVSNYCSQEIRALYDGYFITYGATDIMENLVPGTLINDFKNNVSVSVNTPCLSIGENIIKVNGGYWMRIIPSSNTDYGTTDSWDWIKFSSSALVHGFYPKGKGISIDSTQISDEQNFQHDGKTYILLGVKTTGNKIKSNKFPSKECWENEMFAPWGMSSKEFCIFSCRDIDQTNPTNPIDCLANNRIYTCKHEKDDLRFTVCQQNNIPYLIYLALPYDANTGCYKMILGVSRIRFHEGHAYLDTKREFTNKNGESTLHITDCKSVTNFAVNPNGTHLWIVYEASTKNMLGALTNAFKILTINYIYIDANEIIKRAVSSR